MKNKPPHKHQIFQISGVLSLQHNIFLWKGKNSYMLLNLSFSEKTYKNDIISLGNRWVINLNSHVLL